uniref:Uncharacterized protein n=1 Tax=Anopheles coluzzii TaxID=1518534 RepID=A0A8W7Q1W3_ANOCL
MDIETQGIQDKEMLVGRWQTGMISTTTAAATTTTAATCTFDRFSFYCSRTTLLTSGTCASARTTFRSTSCTTVVPLLAGASSSRHLHDRAAVAGVTNHYIVLQHVAERPANDPATTGRRRRQGQLGRHEANATTTTVMVRTSRAPCRPYLIEISNCELVAIECLYLCDRERGGAVRVFVLRDHVLLSVGGCLLDLLCLGLGNGDGYRAGRVDRCLLLGLLLYLLLLGLLLYDLLRLLSDLIARDYRTVAWVCAVASVCLVCVCSLSYGDRLLTQTLLPTSITALTWFWGTSVGCSWIDVVYVVLSSLCDTVWGARPWMLRQWAACSSDGSCEWSTLTSPRYTNSSSASRSFALTPANITTGCLHGVFC